jgi:hypothetical protein
VLDFGHLGAREIMAARRAMLRRHYFSPRKILSTLRKHVERPSDVVALLSRIPGFLRWM